MNIPHIWFWHPISKKKSKRETSPCAGSSENRCEEECEPLQKSINSSHVPIYETQPLYPLISDPIHSFYFKAAYARFHNDIGAAIISKGTTCQTKKLATTTGAWRGGGGRLEHEDMHSNVTSCQWPNSLLLLQGCVCKVSQWHRCSHHFKRHHFAPYEPFHVCWWPAPKRKTHAKGGRWLALNLQAFLRSSRKTDAAQSTFERASSEISFR